MHASHQTKNSPKFSVCGFSCGLIGKCVPSHSQACCGVSHIGSFVFGLTLSAQKPPCARDRTLKSNCSLSPVWSSAHIPQENNTDPTGVLPCQINPQHGWNFPFKYLPGHFSVNACMAVAHGSPSELFSLIGSHTMPGQHSQPTPTSLG